MKNLIVRALLKIIIALIIFIILEIPWTYLGWNANFLVILIVLGISLCSKE